MFPPGLTNFKRNPGENADVGSIPLKFIVIFKKLKEMLNCQIGQVLEADQNQLVAISLSEAPCIMPIGHRLMIPFTREGMGKVRVNE